MVNPADTFWDANAGESDRLSTENKGLTGIPASPFWLNYVQFGSTALGLPPCARGGGDARAAAS
jgi:hypothetical protein